MVVSSASMLRAGVCGAARKLRAILFALVRLRWPLGYTTSCSLHGMHALLGHLLPADPADGRLRARVRQVRRRRHRAAAPPTDQGAAQEDQPPLPQVHCLQPHPRLRQPVRRAALHHQAARRRQSRHRWRARGE